MEVHLERAKEVIYDWHDKRCCPEDENVCEHCDIVLERLVAAALAACAREAKLEEAKWWHLQVALTAMQSEIIDPGTRDECRERIESLERAVGEKGRA